MFYLLQSGLRRWISSGLYIFLRDVVLLSLLTFGVLIPCFSFNLRHTIYDSIFHKNEARAKSKLIKENSERLNFSSTYLKSLNETGDYRNLKLNLTDYFLRLKSFPKATNVVNTSIAVTIITVSRNRHTIENYEPKYLTQTLAAFLKLLKARTAGCSHSNVGLFVCNVDPQPDSYTEVKTLPKWINVFQRFPHNSWALSNMGYNEKIEKEKQDYVFCLERSLEQNVSHVLLVEDDAIPLPDLFPVLDYLVLSSSKTIGSSLHNVTFFKLYHPERLLGFISLEVERIPELISISCLLSIVLVRIYTKWLLKKSISVSFIWITFFIYSALTLLALGRVNVIEFRRLSKYLYQLTPAPTCCTPAMLFPRQGGRVVADYLKTITCRSKYAKDTALDEFRKKKGLIARMVQPNLFKHIGQFSSLRSALVNPFIV